MQQRGSRRLGLPLVGMLVLGGLCWPPDGLASTSPLCDPPEITAHPQGLTRCEGESASFAVTATGTEPLDYQWRKDGIDIPDATGRTYTIPATVPDDTGDYDVVVTNACGEATSDPATLIVDALPLITQQPADTRVCEGDLVNLTVVVEGAEPLAFQWRKNGVDIDGATDSSYTIDAAALDDAGVYRVRIENDCGNTLSDPATLYVGPPQISQQPVGQTVCDGSRVALAVAALGGDELDTEDTVGTSGFSGSGPKIRANAYAVSTTTLLARIEHYLDITDPGSLIFFVYEADDGGGPYTLIHEDTVADAGTGLGFYASNPVYLTLQAGKYYLIGAAWPGSHGYYYSGDSHPQPTSFGETIGRYAASYGYDYSLPDSPVPNTDSIVYYQRLTTTETSLSFQWRKDDVDIPGAIEATYVVASATPADAGDYEAVVTNECGPTLSDAATVIVAEAEPTITQHPAAQAVCVNDEVTFFVVAEGAGLTYQWRRDGIEINGANEAEFTIGSVSSGHAGLYDVIVTNPCGTVTSNTAMLQVDNTAPGITQQPVSQTICDGHAVTFTVVATGSGLSYQWYKDDMDIPGATESSYTIDPVSYADEGYYEVIVTNGCGSTPSDAATLTIIDTGPTITEQPADASVCESDAVTFTVVADGIELSYQWRKDDVDIPYAIDASYTIDLVTLDDEGAYDVIVSNPCTAVTSDPATLTVETAPTITEHPAAQEVCEGDAVAFTVTADGQGLSYQWRKDDVDIPGATDASYAIDPVIPGDAGDYDVVVSNTCGPVSSDPATLIVIAAAPTITEQPVGQTVCEGLEVTFTVVAAGDNLSYQWRKDGVDVEGAVYDSYAIAVAARDDEGAYDVVVTNACGWVVSEPAALVVDTWPSFTEQPDDQNVCAGEVATFGVVADGTPPLSYQWRKDTVDIPGATSDIYVIDAAAYEDAGLYDVVVTNDCGVVTSDGAVLDVGTAPQIDVQPSGQTGCEGDSVSFAVEASVSAGGVVDTIGSRSSSNARSCVRGNFYTVSTTTTLTRIEHYLDITTSGPLVFFVYEAPVDEQEAYVLIVEDRVSDSGTGEQFYASGPLNVTLEEGKYYIIGTGWPGSHTYYWGGSHPQQTAFGQSLYGYPGLYQDPLPPNAPYNTTSRVFHQRLTTTDATLAYQWRQDGEDISGAVEPIYTIDPVSTDDAGVYDVVVITQCGSVTSEPATLTVDTAPAITQHPQDQAACIGEPVTFEVSAVGTPPFEYQWRKDEQDITGATESTYMIDAATFDDAGAYDVVVSNACGSATSNAAELVVADVGPTINEQPVGGDYCEGDAVVLSVVAEGDGLSYQWRKDDVDIPGATEAMYTIDAVALGDAGDYDVDVANPCGSVVSDFVTITVAERPAGDLDGDGVVGQGDLGILLASWGLDDGGDLDGDGYTGQTDLGILLANWGQSCL